MRLRSRAALTAPVAPVLRDTAGSGTVFLYWAPPAGAASYTLYRGAGGAAPTLLVAGDKSAYFHDNTAANGTTYTYYVVAVNAAGSSPASNTVTATPAAVGPPPVAPVLRDTAGSGTVFLYWAPPAGAASYTLYRGAGGAAPTLLVAGDKSAYFHDNTAANGTTYTYYVVAVNAAGSSPASNTVTATPAPIPAAPTALTATAGSKKVTLAWTAPAGPVTSYSVFRGPTAGGESATALKAGLTTTTYADTTAAVGTTYYYVVKAVNGAGASPASNEASAAATP